MTKPSLRSITSALALLTTLFTATPSFANDTQNLPLWELGIGVGGIYQPYYTGTKQTRQFGFPVITPTYRGKIFKSDDKGLRAQLFKNERLKLDISADFNLALNSDEVRLRKGMDDIDNVLQIGPSFEFLAKETDNSRLFFNVPIRAVFEIGDDFDSRGFNISPNVYYQRQLQLFNAPWTFGATVGPQFGDAQYHGIYYGVAPQFATPERASYRAGGGYSGSRIQLTLKHRKAKHFLLGFLRYENISGASFEDSPLVETDNNLTVGFMYTYTFFQSKRRMGD